MKITKGEFTISTERSRLDLRFIHDYLSKESYWAPGMPMEKLVSAVEHSVNFGLRRWMLHTRDAHGLYAQLGWSAPEKPEAYMERYNPASDWWSQGSGR